MKAKDTRIRLGIFGVGMHFQETYTTALKRAEISNLLDLVWVTDLQTKKSIAEERCKQANQNPIFVGVQSFSGQTLPVHLMTQLDELIAEHPVDAVLVSTTPEQHRAYTEWALAHNIPVLLDKPITSRDNAATDKKQARGILEDWESINAAAEKSKAFVMVNSHRRFHPAYSKVGELLQDIADEYGFGVTSISSFNSDGQWRFPTELRDIQYHGFNTGNGVLSHFGYHYLDLAASWYKKGTPADRRADTALVGSSFSLAKNYAQQITSSDAARVLKKRSQTTPVKDSKEILEALEDYGEVDAFGSIELYTKQTMTAHISIQMLHSGFSQRAWTKPAENLYKENGRVRWENHLIQQGPLHAIEIRSFQAVQPSHYDPSSGLPRWGLGGSDQLEINVFRNRLIGGKPLETIEITDLLTEIPKDDVIHEDVKAKVLQLFIGIVASKKGDLDTLNARDVWKNYVRDMMNDDLHNLSMFSTHQPTVAFMAGMYESYTKRLDDYKQSERAEVSLRW